MSSFKKGDKVSHVKKPQRGTGVIVHMIDGLADIKYDTPRLMKHELVRIRDLKKES